MSRTFFEYFCCPGDAARFVTAGDLSRGSGYFLLGRDTVCFGANAAVPVAADTGNHLPDALAHVHIQEGEVRLPFDIDQLADNLRLELYAGHTGIERTRLGANRYVRDLYYAARPYMPIRFRRVLQRLRLQDEVSNPFPRWPVDRTADRLFEELMKLAIEANGDIPIPFIWFWPQGASAALTLTHDVEGPSGLEFCPKLMDLDSEYGFRAAFQIVPEERYSVPHSFLESIRNRGFEVNVHDLNHDGNLFSEREEFLRRAERINRYLTEFGSQGFRSGALYRNLSWLDALNISYDMSVPNVGHLDPQNGGCCTVMPYFFGDILEIPVTQTQDYSLFHILNQFSIDLWKQQAGIILKGHGLISLIVHPDYIINNSTQDIYRQWLVFLAEMSAAERLWPALPGEINRWWRNRRAMKLVREGQGWHIEGEGSERARLAYAYVIDGSLHYSLGPAPPGEPAGKPWSSTRALVGPQRVGGSEKSGAEAPGGVVQIATENGRVVLPDSLPASFLPTDLTDIPSAPRANESGTQREVLSLTPARVTGGLRVCMVSYSFFEVDNRVMRYADTLTARGDSVDVFALQQGNLPKEEIVNGVRLRRLQSRELNERGRFSFLWRIVQFLFRAMREVSRHHREKKYDLIHVHSVPDFLVFTAWLPRITGTPVILDIHDILPEFYSSKFGSNRDSLTFRLLQFVEKISAAFSSHVIVANHIWQKRLLLRSVQPGKCTVVLNAPDRRIFTACRERRSPNGRFVLLYPGTLNWHQGVDLAIRAFRKICQQAPHADFHIYGEGRSKEELVSLVRELQLEERVLIRKPVPLREIAAVIERADVGVVPKRKDGFGNEAFSTKIMEFMAMGVPVIAPDTDVDRYYFDDSIVRFFRGGDEDDLARAMLELIEKPQKRQLLVDNATRYIETHDWSSSEEEYLNLVDSLVAKSRP